MLKVEDLAIMNNDRSLTGCALEIASRSTMSLNEDVHLSVSPFDMLPVELLTSHLMPFFGSRRFRFVAAVCKKFYVSYTTCFPKKVTEIDASTVEHAKICFSERHDKLHPAKSTGTDDSTLALGQNCVLQVSDGMFFTFGAADGEDVPKTRLCWLASRNADSSVLRYLHSIGCEWDENVCWSLSDKGDLETLQWVRAQGCPWDQRTCSRAALKGHLHILRWARDHEAPWCHVTPANAAIGGHFDVLEWVTANGCPVNFFVYIYAARNGNLPMLQWIDENRESFQYDDDQWSVRFENICASAAASGSIEVLKWCLEKGYSMDSRTCSCAAAQGHLNVLKWARNKGCPWYEDTCSDAAMRGRFQVLKYAHSNGCPWDSETSLSAAKHNRLVILKWAHSMGCPWHKRLCLEAAWYGRLCVLIWAQLNGCPWRIDKLPEYGRDRNTTVYLYCLRDQNQKNRLSEFMFQVSIIFKDYLCKCLEREEMALSGEERGEIAYFHDDEMSDVMADNRMMAEIVKICHHE